MKDNLTAHSSTEYDEQIIPTIPYYNLFYPTTFELVQSINGSPNVWLDTGCGTGNILTKAKKLFPATSFILADPSQTMIDLAKCKYKNDSSINYSMADTQSLDCADESIDVITAIQCHHYLSEEARKDATKNCFRMLKKGGIYITFENIKPYTEQGVNISLKRWGSYQISQGRPPEKVQDHLNRYNKNYFPITVSDHLKLLSDIGFEVVEILWLTYMQAGFYAIK